MNEKILLLFASCFLLLSNDQAFCSKAPLSEGMAIALSYTITPGQTCRVKNVNITGYTEEKEVKAVAGDYPQDICFACGEDDDLPAYEDRLRTDPSLIAITYCHYDNPFDCARFLHDKSSRETSVSLNYIIGKDGSTLNPVPLAEMKLNESVLGLEKIRKIAYALASSYFDGKWHLNNHAISIMIYNDEKKNAPEATLSTLAALIKDLTNTYNITHIGSFAEFAPGRYRETTDMKIWRFLSEEGALKDEVKDFSWKKIASGELYGDKHKLLSDLLGFLGYATADIDQKFDKDVNSINKHRRTGYADMATAIKDNIAKVVDPFLGRFGYLIKDESKLASMQERDLSGKLSEKAMNEIICFAISLIESSRKDVTLMDNSSWNAFKEVLGITITE